MFCPLYLCSNGQFPGESGLADTRMLQFETLLQLRAVLQKVMEVVVTTGTIRYAKLQSKYHYQQTNTQGFFTDRMPFLLPNQRCQSSEGKICSAICQAVLTLILCIYILIPSWSVLQKCGWQAVGGRPPRYSPATVCAACCGPATAHTRLAWGAQRTLLPVAVGSMNIHDVCDVRQTKASLNAPAY